MKNNKVRLLIEIVLFIGALCIITFVYYFGGEGEQTEEGQEEVGIVEITDDNFEEEVLNSQVPVILEFSSNSCPPCLTMIPTMIDIAKNNKDIKVGSVNSESNTSQIIEDYNIEAYPTIIIFNNGEVQKVFIGVTSEDTILQEVK